MIVSISKGYQLTIPAEIRNELGLGIGSRVDILKKDSKIIVEPVKEEIGLVFEEAKRKKPRHNLTPKQMDELNERMLR